MDELLGIWSMPVRGMEVMKGGNPLKKNPLYYVIIAFIILVGISMCFPNILGWNVADKWVMGVPMSMFGIYIHPLLITLGMGGLYLIDVDYEKKKAAAKLGEKGGEK